MHKIDVTFGEDVESMMEALRMAESEGGIITAFKATGSSGGMPDVTIAFATRNIAKTWLQDVYYYGDGDPEDIEEILSYDDIIVLSAAG